MVKETLFEIFRIYFEMLEILWFTFSSNNK